MGERAMNLTGAVIRPIETESFQRSEQACKRIVEFAGSEEADEMTESELEREFEKQVRELKRQLLQDHLDRRAGGGRSGRFGIAKGGSGARSGRTSERCARPSARFWWNDSGTEGRGWRAFTRSTGR